MVTLRTHDIKVKPVNSGHAMSRTPGNSEHFFKEPTESRSIFHRKTSI